jgi:hypothetical protein
MANEVKYTRNGRTYKLVESKNEICCGLCCFYHQNKEEFDKLCGVFSESEMDCTEFGYFRETILSKLLYPFRIILLAISDVFYFSATGQGRT